jgi:opacity protein-like surface antigen
MQTFLAVICCVVVAAGSSAAQDSTQSDREIPLRMGSEEFWGVGLQAGTSTGWGLSARFAPASRWAFEANGIYTTLGSKRSTWSLAAEAQFELETAFDHRVYLMGGAGYHFWSDTDRNNILNKPFRASIGPAYEWFFSRRASVAAELPITLFFGDRIEVYPFPQVQFMYYFQVR